MERTLPHHCLLLTGATGSGKTALGIEWAEHAGAEIISMDSMALYRGMDIGTAKPDPEQRRRVPHHLIDVLDPWESSSVAWWLEQARASAGRITQKGKRVLFVGGTPLYVKALLRGLFPGPGRDDEIRRRLENEAREHGTRALHEKLAGLDRQAAGRIHPNDLRRIVRALEVFEVTGRPISEWQQQWAHHAAAGPDAPPRALWLDVPRAELYDRINRRVEDMFAAGLVDEVKKLRELPRPISREARQALGYKEVFDHLDGKETLQATITLVQTRSRNYAKRQISWFRHLPEIRPVTRELTANLWHLKICN
jgi:tRNA dimethylallyltransferase